MGGFMFIIGRPTPEQIASQINVREGSVYNSKLSHEILRSQVSYQKVEALRCRLEIAAARAEVQEYLVEGERGSYKNREVPYVEGGHLRHLVLKAGYTEFALGVMKGFGATDLEVSKHFPQEDKNRMTISVGGPNRYNFPLGTYDAIDAVSWLIATQKPDYPSGQDPLRRRVLKDIEEVEGIRKSLIKKGEYIISLEAWDFGLSGRTRFLLNPGRTGAEFGWYTVPQLRGWLNGNPRSTVLTVNKKERELKEKRHLWTERYAEHLGRLSKREDKEGRRLFRMALMDCPFTDLVKRYAPDSS